MFHLLFWVVIHYFYMLKHEVLKIKSMNTYLIVMSTIVISDGSSYQENIDYKFFWLVYFHSWHGCLLFKQEVLEIKCMSTHIYGMQIWDANLTEIDYCLGIFHLWFWVVVKVENAKKKNCENWCEDKEITYNIRKAKHLEWQRELWIFHE